MKKRTAKKMEKQEDEQLFFEQYGFLYGEKIIPKNTVYSLHWHDYFECEILFSGRANHRFNEEEYEIKPGDAYVLSYEDTHSIRILEDLHIFAIRFREDLLPPETVRLLTEKSGNCHCRFEPQTLTYLESRLNHLRCLDQNCFFYKQMMTMLLGEIILLVLEQCPGIKGNSLPSLVQKTISYTRQHFQEPLTLAVAARMYSVTPKYLGTLFKETTHVSFHDFLNNTRLRHACHLLTTTDLSVKEIAFSAGYASVEYFLDVFKRRMGTTPTIYRTRNIHSSGIE